MSDYLKEVSERLEGLREYYNSPQCGAKHMSFEQYLISIMMAGDLDILEKWLRARPNNAAIFASDTGFVAQTVNEVSEPQEAESITIGSAIGVHESKYGKWVSHE